MTQDLGGSHAGCSVLYHTSSNISPTIVDSGEHPLPDGNDEQSSGGSLKFYPSLVRIVFRYPCFRNLMGLIR
jgi:hypothetical protein